MKASVVLASVELASAELASAEQASAELASADLASADLASVEQASAELENQKSLLSEIKMFIVHKNCENIESFYLGLRDGGKSLNNFRSVEFAFRIVL